MEEKIRNFGDEDVKIAGKKPEKGIAERQAQAAFDELMRARSDGNLQSAKKIGEDCACCLLSDSDALPCLKSFDEKHFLQCRWLLIFSATVGFERYCPSAVLARAALDGFNGELEKSMPEIFVGSGYSTAMSFYYLAVRGGFHVEKEIGRTFAMLCGDELNAELSNAGIEIFEGFVSFIEAEIEKSIK